MATIFKYHIIHPCCIIFVACVVIICSCFCMEYEHATKCLYSVFVNKKAGFIDDSGSLVISPMFDATSEFSNGVAVVCVNSLYGLINEKGEYLIKPIY